jgi:hypothetical protein
MWTYLQRVEVRVVMGLVLLAFFLLLSQCIVSPKSSITILRGGIDEKGY